MATPRAKASTQRAETAPASAPAVAPEPIREVPRSLMPIIPGRVVFTNRAGQPIQRSGVGTGVDDFHIPPHLPPPGWSWEFKRETNRGMTDAAYIAKMHRAGWEHVMYESYPGEFAPEYDNNGAPIKGPVRIGGQFLMERRMEATLEARAEEKRIADERVMRSKNQYNKLDTSGTQTAQFDDTARRTSYVKQRSEEVVYPTNNPSGRQPID